MPSPPRLTRDALVDTGVALADREGLEAVSIRRLAGEAGVTPMALYWHVRDKDQLLAALRDRLLSEVELPRPRAASAWARELREVLEALLDALVRHPALAPLALTGLFESEPGLALVERVYGLMEAAGFSDEECAHQGAFLLASVVALVTAWPSGDGHTERVMPEVPADAFPIAARLAPAVGAKDLAQLLDRGLDVLIAGLVGLARRRR